MVGIVKATNPQEATEFIDMFFHWGPVFIVIGITVFCYFLYKIFGKIKPNRIVTLCALLLVVMGVAATTIKKSANWGRVFIGKPFLYLSYQLPPDLSCFYSDLKLKIEDEDKLPDNIVFIIGESFTKFNSSLYGYEKQTNPRLQELVRDSLLYVYSNVVSPGTHTIHCFQNMMSTYNDTQKDTLNWYEGTTVIELLDKTGYTTTWVSNQSQKGGYDNVVAKYAELCDTSLWVGNKFAGTNRMSYDEEVLPLLKSVAGDDSDLNFYCVHLIGSHYTFDSRYPTGGEWSVFKENDYDYPKHQRYNRAAYDNSVLYNDFVVREIIKLFEDKESLVFYFSDHGIDLYYSSDDYVGHATNAPVSVEKAKQIPYMIYVSPALKEANSEMADYINSHKNRTINTADVIYELMRIIGVSIN